MAHFPEIEQLGLKDTREALKLGYFNFSSLTPAGQADLLPRIKALETRLEKLQSRRRA